MATRATNCDSHGVFPQAARPIPPWFYANFQQVKHCYHEDHEGGYAATNVSLLFFFVPFELFVVHKAFLRSILSLTCVETSALTLAINHGFPSDPTNEPDRLLTLIHP